MPAAVAEMIPQQRLGGAYGACGGVLRVSWFVGSAAVATLYDLVRLAVDAELFAIVPLLVGARHRHTPIKPG